jgi:hypothetical protein
MDHSSLLAYIVFFEVIVLVFRKSRTVDVQILVQLKPVTSFAVMASRRPTLAGLRTRVRRS